MSLWILNSIRDALRDGEDIDIHSHSMSLVAPDARRPRYQGPGKIQIRRAGRLGFTMYSQMSDTRDPRDPRDVGAAGTLVPSDQYYRLTVKDDRGLDWIGERVYDISWRNDDGWKNVVVTGDLLEIVGNALKATPDLLVPLSGSELALYVFDNVDIPTNVATSIEEKVQGEDTSRQYRSMLNVAKFESVDHRFEFTRHDDLLELRTTTQSMTDGLHHRVIEALQFVLARPVPWKLLTFDGDVKSFRIRSEPKLSIIPTSYPPIDSVRFHDLTLCVWPLYIKYFDFIRDHPPHSWHPLSMFFYSVIEARAAGFDTFRLALGVAVEGILKTAFSDLCPTSDDFFAAADDAKRHLSDWKWKQPHDEAGLKRRLMGFFGQLRNPRADDKLRRLVAAEVITKEEHESWKELRNKAAHAYRPDRPPDQSEIDQGMRATTLMHKLIFQAIGYSGKYTDYGTHGFPMREFVAVAL